MRGVDDAPAGLEPPDRLDHLPLGIVEPRFRVAIEFVPADLLAERQQLALGDAHGAKGRQIVAPPDFRHPNPVLAHAHDVGIVLIVPLDLDGREDERAFVVDVDDVAEIGRGLRVAAVGLMGLGQNPVAQHSGRIDHRNHQTVIGGVRIALVRGVVQETVPGLELRMVAVHRPADDVRADQRVRRQAFRRGEQLAIGREHNAGKVVRRVEDARARRAEERILHFARDAVHPARQDRHADAVGAPLVEP